MFYTYGSYRRRETSFINVFNILRSAEGELPTFAPPLIPLDDTRKRKQRQCNDCGSFAIVVIHAN